RPAHRHGAERDSRRPSGSFAGQRGGATGTGYPVRRGCAKSGLRLTYNHVVVDQSGEAEGDLIFRALADATRRDIIGRVMRAEQSVAALAGHYPMSFAAVQKHVAVLERAGLVLKERRGREQVVHAGVEALRLAARLLGEYEQIWRHRAEGMAAILAADNG